MPYTLIKEDITKMDTDAIVNAANSSLLGGGGVDGAIHRAAGPELLEECKGLHGCVTGDAKITKGYNLKARYVIHTVGPIYEDGNHHEKELLYSCYWKSLELAAANNLESIAFPLISSGAYGYPPEEALRVATDAITRFLETHDMDVYMVLYGVRLKTMGSRLYDKLQKYLSKNYVDENAEFEAKARNPRRSIPKQKHQSSQEPMILYQMAPTVDLGGARMNKDGSFDFDLDESFSEMLLRLIKQKGMAETECYKKANIDRKLFSKIRSNKDYRPSKQTVCAFAIALQLSPKEAKAMLETAGFALSHSVKFDCIITYFLKEKIYDIFTINNALYDLDQPLLGSL